MDDPATYEEALRQGYKPIGDLDAYLTERKVTGAEFAARKHEFAARMGMDCKTAPPGSKCLDWTDDTGVRTICYCTQAKACGNCVQK